ncbi:hypothetical protein [uncultured Dysgonomonas sp.]|uniref:Phage head morphogenesis domain-containing protein n=1 Tax=uncultured Dysgonomonas sp. TaxID=206096 RepID=A0A212IXW8_9BACT|nr:hypothetical protein [uncultured Dysgonomonas sp.]SBV91964.1 hypothetical protein KL86DYS1_10481 [uncultured Dysgonomonas sp.]
MTESQKISEAKKYISQVVDQMILADSDLRRIIKRDIGELIDECLAYSNLGKAFQFSANPQLEKAVNDILDKLRTDLFNIIYIRAENVDKIAHKKEDKNRDNNSLLLAFLTAEIANKTLEMRIADYVSQMRSEVEAFVAAGIFKGLNKDQILNAYLANIQKPYLSPILLEAFREGGFKAERIVSKGITFGTGKYVAAFNNLKRLEQDTIFRAYSHIEHSIWSLDNSYIGWMTYRNSGYDCPNYCQPQVGVFHPKTEFFWGWHSGCVCLCIPIYKNDIV